MHRSGLEGEKGARTVAAETRKQQEDLKMYSRLPYYAEFQWYDMGIDAYLSESDEKIYANFHKPPCQTLGRHLLMVDIPEKLFREHKF